MRALAPHLVRLAGRRGDVVVETIDGAGALSSPPAGAFVAAGFRVTTSGLRYYASLGERR